MRGLELLKWVKFCFEWAQIVEINPYRGGKKFAESLSLWRLRITKSGFERVIITHNYTADIFGRKSLTIHNYTLGNNYTLPDYNFWFFLKDLYTSQKLHDKKKIIKPTSSILFYTNDFIERIPFFF